MVKKILFLLLFFLFSLYVPVYAETQQEYEQQEQEYRNKLAELSKQKNTLSNQIKIFDTQIAQTELKIKQTISSIEILKNEIADLGVKIGNLDVSLNNLSAVYIQQVAQNYKLGKRMPFKGLLNFSSLNNFLQNYKYISVLQQNSHNTLMEMETNRTNMDIQKQAKTEKQKELENQEKTLKSQQKSLANQKLSKNELLQITKNDEKKYQALLSQVQAKLSTFSNTTVGCLSSNAPAGSDGNYYSQLDNRWCSQYIGPQTIYTIGNAGCYLTSMSMLLKKIGYDISPSAYAADISRFTSSADLANPSVPDGYKYQKISSYDTSAIDRELSNNRYVIVQVPMRGSPSGYHFVVLISGSSGNYIMHDPVYGPDKNFSQYYSRVISVRLITK